MKQKKETDDIELRNHLAMRATDRDLARLDALAHAMAGRWGLRVTRTEVLRLAVHKGLHWLELEEKELENVKVEYDK